MAIGLGFASDPAEVSGTVSLTTVAGTYDSSYVPGAIAAAKPSGYGNRDCEPFTFEWAALSGADLYLHWEAYWGGQAANFDNSDTPRHVVIRDALDNDICILNMRSTTFRLKAVGATTEFDDATTTWARNTKFTFDLKVSVDASNIVCEFYINGTLEATATAANTTSGYGDAKKAYFENNQMPYVSGAYTVYHSQLMALDSQSSVGGNLAVLAPDGDGGETDWSGDYTTLTGSGDAEMTAASAALRSSWTLSEYGGAASPNIEAVAVQTTLSRDLSGPQNVTPFLRLSSTNYDGAAGSQAADGVVRDEWTTNPATASAWAEADLASLEAGLLSVA